jgi:transglutaminase-like putative cysteine protease
MVARAGTTRALAAGEGVGYRLDETIRYDYDHPVRHLRQRLMVVPPAEHGSQRRLGWDLTVDGSAVTKRRSGADRFGNRVIDVYFERVESWVTFSLFTSVEHCDGSGPHLTTWRRTLLRPTHLTRPDAAIEALADEVRRASDPAAAVTGLVHRALRYEWGITDVGTTAAQALRGGVGVCQDYAHLMIATCLAAGIAARYVSGHLLGEGGSHAWVEILQPHPSYPGQWRVQGWDPTNGRRTDDRHVTVAVGRDYGDVSPMSGTYEGDGTGNRLSVSKSLAPAAPVRA